MSRLLQDKTRQDFFPRVPLPPSLLEFMHGVADGLGYLVMVLGYGELFYNSTFLRQAVAGRVHVRCKSFLSSSHRHFQLCLMVPIPKYTRGTL